MDGTLVNSSLTIVNAINYVRRYLGYAPMDPEDILEKVNDPTINPAYTFYHARDFEPIHEELFMRYYTNNHNKELALYDGVDMLLEALKDHNKSIALATNAYRHSTIESLRHLGIEKYFDSIVCYDDVLRGKPEPDMLYRILEELGHPKDHTLFVGDGARDQFAAQKAGIDYVMVDWGFSNHQSRAVGSIEALHSILL